MEELQELWLVLKLLPGETWIQALFLFIAVGLAKWTGVVRDDGWAAGANMVLSIVMNGGFKALDELTMALQTMSTAVIAAAYYQIWKHFVRGWVTKALDLAKASLAKK